ncbi:MAG: 50S ribosomal protein L25 [Patescibacteria group bacterium]
MTITLAVTARDTSKKSAVVRKEGGVPGIVYGPKQTPVAISVSGKDFEKVLKEAGESTIVELSGLEESIEVLVKDVDFDPIKREVRHVDFYAIERGKDMTVNVALEFIGAAPVEKSNLGVVTKVLHEVEVTCRPNALPNHIDVDVSVLATIEDKIHVSDLAVPAGVKINNDPTENVAVVTVVKEEAPPEPTTIDMSAIEVEAKGKAPEEEAPAE